jgi:hypothetical protein
MSSPQRRVFGPLALPSSFGKIYGMQTPELLVLDLRSPLFYHAAANPPSPSSVLSEGEEELLAFDTGLLVTEDPEGGPRIKTLPSASFRGSSKGEGGLYTIEAGRYAFMQLSEDMEGPAASLEHFAANLEYFAREAWWEGVRLEGPYLVRILGEDGKTTVQLLRRHAQ